ncbi:hypothetical protein J7J83_03695 [bacterium]|nr:hypothetical protein [bacterium]
MKPKSQESPDLKLVKPLSLAEKARLVAQEVKDNDALEEEQRVEHLLHRLTEINDEFTQVDKVIKGLSRDQREKVLATLEEDTSSLESEKDEILNDEGVQIAHIQELIKEANQIDSWRELKELVESAIARGWFKEPKRNKKGNISYHALESSDTENRTLKGAMRKLKKTIIQSISKLASKK